MSDEYKPLEHEDGLLVAWRHIQDIVETVGPDVFKNASGNVAAGVRGRRGMRKLIRLVRDLVKTTVERDKTLREQRRDSKKVEM